MAKGFGARVSLSSELPPTSRIGKRFACTGTLHYPNVTRDGGIGIQGHAYSGFAEGGHCS